MKAARLHAYHEALKLEEVDDPKVLGPLDVIVKIGADAAFAKPEKPKPEKVPATGKTDKAAAAKAAPTPPPAPAKQ